jgi:hypothetical protein
MMKILVATMQLQQQRSNDFGWATEGEVVTFASECDGEAVDGHCGCRRAMSGMVSHKATTTFRVVELDATVQMLAQKLAEGLVEAGWYPTIEKAMPVAVDDARELARLAAVFPVGSVLEKRGDKVQVRQPAIPKAPKKARAPKAKTVVAS